MQECIEYTYKEIFAATVPEGKAAKLLTKTEFPLSWTAEKIVEEAYRLTEKAFAEGLLNSDVHAAEMITNDGFKLKIITDSDPINHLCESIENTVNRHIITARPDKG